MKFQTEFGLRFASFHLRNEVGGGLAETGSVGKQKYFFAELMNFIHTDLPFSIL